MADKTSIEWCHATINAISGCTPVSPGCTNCYAMRSGGMNRPHHPSNGLTQPSKAGHVWTGAVRLNEEWLRKPLAWQQPRRIFWNAHGDPWHESVPFEWVDREMAIAALTPRHRHLFVTKRSARMRRYFANPHTPERILEAAKRLKALPTQWSWPLPNVWLGVSVEDQTRADERIPDLLATPAAVRFLSAEPLLGSVDIEQWLHDSTCTEWPGTCICTEPREIRVDWVIIGGESGPGSRPMHPDWARNLRDQCNAARVPFLFKQWGDWVPASDGFWPHNASVKCRLMLDGTRHPRGHAMWRTGKRAAGRTLDRVIWDQYPELFPHEQLQPAPPQDAVPA